MALKRREGSVDDALLDQFHKQEQRLSRVFPRPVHLTRAMIADYIRENGPQSAVQLALHFGVTLQAVDARITWMVVHTAVASTFRIPTRERLKVSKQGSTKIYSTFKESNEDATDANG